MPQPAGGIPSTPIVADVAARGVQGSLRDSASLRVLALRSLPLASTLDPPALPVASQQPPARQLDSEAPMSRERQEILGCWGDREGLSTVMGR
jgi:hypothetical protein